MLKTEVVWKEGLAFSTRLDGHEQIIDADRQQGGQGLGPRPKGLLLSALAGCTAMDVVSILTKMQVPLAGLSVEAEGQEAGQHPKRFVRIVLRYRFSAGAGGELPLNKLHRAVRLSQENYCGVRSSLDPAIELSSELYVDGIRLAVTGEHRVQ